MSLQFKIEIESRCYESCVFTKQRANREKNHGKKLAVKMYHKTEVGTNDQLQERTENYQPTVTDRNSVVKARSSQEKKSE